MTQTRFYFYLLLTAMVSLIIGITTGNDSQTSEIYKATYLLIFFFVVFTLVMFIFSSQAMRSTDPYLFTRVFMISVGLKILLLSALVFACIKFLVIKPRELVIPLLSSYLLFTILETWVLMKLSKKY